MGLANNKDLNIRFVNLGSDLFPPPPPQRIGFSPTIPSPSSILESFGKLETKKCGEMILRDEKYKVNLILSCDIKKRLTLHIFPSPHFFYTSTDSL